MESGIKRQGKQNPRTTANPLSALFFIYMFPLFWKNYKKEFTEDDLFETLDEHKSNKLGTMLEKVWKEEDKRHKHLALHRALLRIVGFDLAITGLVKFINEMLLIIIMPLAMGKLVSYFKNNSETPKGTAYAYACLIILTLLTDTLLNHPMMMRMAHIGMKMRVSCCALIYRKSLKLSHAALAQTNTGQIVNLLSNDVTRFDQGFVLCHFAWIAPIETAVGTYLLYTIIGPAAFSGIGFLLLFIPLQTYIGKLTSVLRLKTALRTDERVRLMNEILNGIQVIKMYAWEKPFVKLISLARRYEIKSIRYRCFLQAIMFSLEAFITRTAIFISIIVYVFLGHHITAETAYTMTAVYNVLRPVITVIFSISITSIAEVYVSINRIEGFLRSDELPQAEINYDQNSKIEENDSLQCHNESLSIREIPHLFLKQVNARWISDSSECTLTNINLNIDDSGIIAVVGPVGSGKSSLLYVILRELSIFQGLIDVHGKIAYASQEAWLFSASIRQNITFGEAYEEERYKNVLKICALEPDLAIYPHGDQTKVGEKGKSLSGGQKARINLARCIYKRADIYLLDDPFSAVDATVGKQLYDECITKFLKDKICVLVTHQLQYLEHANKIIVLREGNVAGEGTYEELRTSGLDIAQLLQEFSSMEEEKVDSKRTIESKQSLESLEQFHEEEMNLPEAEQETVYSGQIKAVTYLSYFRCGGNYFIMFLLALAFIASQAAGNCGDYFVSYWVNLEQMGNDRERNNTINRDRIIFIYSSITIITIFLALAHSIYFFSFFTTASINMHGFIFEKISYAKMKFFNANPSGRILNRFSKDIGIIDEYIPFVLNDVIQITLIIIGTITLTAIVNPWLILPSVGLLSTFYLIRMVYIETARSVKRLEGKVRSSIFSHVTASMQGLSTIRAYLAQNTLMREFDDHQDLHSSSWYLFISASRAFAMWLDIICNAFISLVTISLLALNKDYHGGDVGLILTQYLSIIGIFQWGMLQWSELENHMTSVERVLEYTKVETEPVRESNETLPNDWPERGKVVFNSITMKYNSNTSPALKNLSFTIHPREKVGIVGRTGAGKSSIVAALFQLYDIEGCILIDDVDITKLALDKLRSKISIIPQEPVLFSGTIRKNLDPFEEYTDDMLWRALEDVEMKSVIVDTEAGLHTNVSESGSNFSIGQRQLICLARAIVRNNKILVMDEATASIDSHTDFLIQNTIRERFVDCTVITIAHRLHTIMDSDRVLVMDAGRAVEFDHPHHLLQRSDSIFYAMVQTAGDGASKNLHTIAEMNFTRQNEINLQD